MFRAKVRAPVGVLVTTCAMVGILGMPGSARAEGAGGDDHTFAQHLVDELERGNASVASDALREAKDALERATRLRAAGDEAHAKAADGLAREWAETGRDVALAAAAEEQAAERRRKATAAEAQLERTRALVEEGVARVGRARAELDAAVAAPHPRSQTPAARAATAPHEPHDKPAGKPAAPLGGSTP